MPPDGPAGPPLKGKPRTVRIEKVDYPLAQAVAPVTVEMDYDPAGRIIERRVYRTDGTLSFHEAFQYEPDPRVHTVRVLSAQGEVLSTRKVVAHPDGEESTVSSPSGQITERTTTRRDSAGRVLEAVSQDTVRGHEIRMPVDYRAERPEAHVTFSQDGRRDLVLVPGGAVSETIIHARDAEGNWTRKTVVERDPSTGAEVVIASVDRTITYYAD